MRLLRRRVTAAILYGGNSVMGLRVDLSMDIHSDMNVHVLSWLISTGKSGVFISNTVLLTDHGTEVLIRTPAGPIIR
jgi:Xaa-Pro dipeptidase